MNSAKSIWTSITGGLSSTAPVLLACCKSGACVGVCASPVAALFGVSSATLAASPLTAALEPLLIAVSAVAFTVSYYTLYKIPKLACGKGECGCNASVSKKRSVSISKAVFWLGLLLSIGFLSYFQYDKYHRQQTAAYAATCEEGNEETCCSGEDATNGMPE